MVKILLHGLAGPVDGIEYPSVMPSLEANPDEWVAAVTNYVRYELGTVSRRFRRRGDTASLYVTPAEVAAIRAQYASKKTPWTIAELENNTTSASAGTSVSTVSTGSTETSVAKKSSLKPAGKSSGQKATAKTIATKKPGYNEVLPLLLQKNACLSCHNPTTKQIGPSYTAIAAKRYSVVKLVALIQKPDPANWKEYSTRMPPMGHVPKAELTRIAEWIKTLEK